MGERKVDPAAIAQGINTMHQACADVRGRVARTAASQEANAATFTGQASVQFAQAVQQWKEKCDLLIKQMGDFADLTANNNSNYKGTHDQQVQRAQATASAAPTVKPLSIG